MFHVQAILTIFNKTTKLETKYDLVKSIAKDIFKWSLFTGEKVLKNSKFTNLTWQDSYAIEDILRGMVIYLYYTARIYFI